MFEEDRAMQSADRGWLRRSGGAGSLFRDAGDTGEAMTGCRVSGVDDDAEIRAEREADRVTGSVFREPADDGGIFRDEEGLGDEGGEVSLPTADLERPGQALPSGVRDSMEQSFGTGFSGVRVHNDDSADRLSRRVSARAFTRGQDVYFRDGEYDPGSREGRHLIAHELAHVAAGNQGLQRDFMENDERKGSADFEKKAAFAVDFCAKSEQYADLLSDKATLKDKLANGQYDLDEFRKFCENRQTILAQKDGLKRELTDMLPAAGSQTAGQEDEHERHKREVLQAAIEKIDNTFTADVTAVIMGSSPDSVCSDEDVKRVLDGKDQAAPPAPTDAADLSQVSESAKNMLNSDFGPKFFEMADKVRAASDGIDVDAAEAGAFQSAAEKNRILTGPVKKPASRASEIAGKAAVSVGNAKLGDVTTFTREVGKGATDAEKAKIEKTNAQVKAVGRAGTAAQNTARTAAGAVNIGVDAVRVNEQRKARREKLDAMGLSKVSAADHTANAGLAAKAIQAASDAGAGIGVAVDDSKAKAGLGWTAGGARLVGDTLDMSAAGARAEQNRKQDQRAKSSMRAIGSQLKQTLPPPEQTANGQPEYRGRSARINDVCQRVQKDRLNDSKTTMAGLIDEAMDPRAPADRQPELTGNQTRLLTMMRALEISRADSKEAASGARLDAYASAISLAGNLIQNVGKALSDSFVGAILSVVGRFIGVGSDIVGALKGKAKDDGEKRDARVEASRSAIRAMAGLPAPAHGFAEYREMVFHPAPAPEAGKKESGKKLTNADKDCLEQYAAVYSIVEAANVDMTDILFALHSGFNAPAAPPGVAPAADERTLDQRMRDTYASLSA